MKNKTKVLGLIIVILCAVIIFLITRSGKVEAPIISNVEPVTNGYETVGYSFKKDDVETDTTSIHITQPVVTGLPSNLINNIVNSQLDTAFGDIKKLFIADTAGVDIFSKDMKHQLTVNGGTPLSASKKVFYVDTEINSYISGSAHPLSQRSVYNFVKETGQLIRLEDILKRESGEGSSDTSAVATDKDFKTSLTGISNLVKPKIMEQLKKMSKTTDGTSPDVSKIFEPSGADPKLENYGVFYVHEDRIEWVFGQYQVAPYVFGEIKISVPMNELESYLAPRSYLK
ncbi:MAG: RsiV family protein [Candidatus Pacebacteria bacterium]|nr:RsiV family protein [Candidatus Paceibacterota bacterium]